MMTNGFPAFDGRRLLLDLPHQRIWLDNRPALIEGPHANAHIPKVPAWITVRPAGIKRLQLPIFVERCGVRPR